MLISYGIAWGSRLLSSSLRLQCALTEQTTVDLEIDVVGLKCPLPVLKLKKRVAPLPPGATVKLITSDETTLKDVPAYCDLVGHTVTHTSTDAGRYIFWIQLSETSS